MGYEKEKLTKLLDDTVKILIDDTIKIENKDELAIDMDNVEDVLQELKKKMQVANKLVANNEIRDNNELILKNKLDEIMIKNKGLENENLLLKENLNIKEAQLVKYKAEFKQLQFKI